MEILFLLLLILLMALALGSGYPVAFALPGSAIVAVLAAAICGYLFAGDVDAFFAHGGPGQWLSAGVTNLRGIYWEPERDTLIAIPLFIFMGIMLQRSRIAEDLLLAMAQLFGPIPGGLGISVVFVGALLAATTGIVGATVVAMGLISLPAMLKNNYSKPLATGTIAASGTLGQIIPPSIVLIILADQLASAADQAGTARTNLYKAATGELTMPSPFNVAPTSAGEMFLGAVVPGLVLVALYMLFILVRALINPKVAPPVPYHGKYDAAFARGVFLALVPPLALILLVLGSIITGVATVNQAGAIGAAGAMIMAGYKLKDGSRGAYYPLILALVSLVAIVVVRSQFTVNIKSVDTDRDLLGVVLVTIALGGLIASLAWSAWRTIRIGDTMRGVVIETAKTTSLVFIILLGAAMLTAAFRAFGGEELVRDFLTSLPGGFWAQFVVVMAVIFVLGFFLDFIEIAVVVVPIVSPILLADPEANITAVWLGVMIGLNIQTSFLTPPFGFALFYLRGVAPAIVKTIDIYKGVVAFIALQLAALVVVGYAPPLVNYLPTRMSLLSVNAPPPRNPGLQYCVESYVLGELAARESTIRKSIADVQAMDLSGLPEPRSKRIGDALENATMAFDLAAEVRSAQAAAAAAAGDYGPLQRRVRALERDARKFDAEIADIQTRLSRLRGDDEDTLARRVALSESVAALQAEKDAILSGIPADWNAVHDRFAELNRAETKAGNAFRRAADGAHGPVADIVTEIQGANALVMLKSDIAALQAALKANNGDAEDAAATIEESVGDIANVDPVRSAVSDARKALDSDTPDVGKAMEALAEAQAAIDAELAWRQPAQAMLPQLVAYEEAVRTNLGLRQLPRLPREQALEVAACQSHHRDISLSF